jgi:preprotein translocase subunit SecG
MDGFLYVCGSTLFLGTLFMIVFGFFAYLRYLRHKETIAMIEKGILQAPPPANGKGALTWGIVITALGLALSAGLYPIGWLVGPNDFPLNFGPWMLVGLLPTFFGLALILIYLVTHTRKSKNEEAEPVKEIEQLPE